MSISLSYSRKFLLLLVLLVSFKVSFVSGQQLNVRSGFLSDSVKVGEETAFYLSVKYPSDLNLIFPDSTFSFFPFEYENKRFFPTKTSNGISSDSTVYYISTFELDPVQALQLPVYVVSAQDCTTYLSNTDSIRLVHVVPAIPDTVTVQNLPLKANTAYQDVRFQFNYIILAIILAAVLLLVVVAWVIFGKRISSYFKSRRLMRMHRQFIINFEKGIQEVQRTFSPKTTEATLSVWKKYMEQLESKPYTKLTTREMARLYNDDTLRESLRHIDSSIYGHGRMPASDFENLREFANQRFAGKIQEVRHGK